MNLIPKVNGNILKNEGYFLIKDSIEISNLTTYEETTDLFITRTRKRLGIEIVKGDNEVIQLIENNIVSSTGYKLSVSEYGVRVEFSTGEGLGYALTTLYHLLVEAVLKNEGCLNCVTINDSPKYNHRGLSVDTSRHYFPLEELKKIVEQMALVKLNVMHWHIVDDQGFRLESKVFPELNKAVGDEYYRQEEVKDLINFARIRGIDVIPEIDMPGHTSAIIQAYPELSCRGEAPEINERTRIYKDILCGGKPEVYDFITKLLTEVVELFSDYRIHLGGDEAPKSRWEECPHCKAKLEAEGLNSFEELQSHFLNFAKKHLEKYNKTVTCWNDSLKGDGLDKDINIQYWLDTSIESYSPQKIREQGRKVVFSEVFSFYTDYTHNMIPLKKTYDYVPSIRGISFEDYDGIIGMEACIWCEIVYNAQDMQRQVFPRVIALAESAWTTEKNYDCFVERLRSYYDELDFGGITGKTAIEDAGTYDEGRVQRVLTDFATRMGGGVTSDEIGMSPEEMQAMMQVFLGNFFTPEEMPKVMEAMQQMMH